MIVFFFKQKTAYEMRISDWSSDVCSSDLRTTSARQALVICTAWLTPIEKIRNGTRIDIGSMPKPISGRMPTSHSTGSRATTSATSVNRTERVYRYSSTRVMTNRSEEHTSELQSLMRISYAVFCLKKKQN